MCKKKIISSWWCWPASRRTVLRFYSYSLLHICNYVYHTIFTIIKYLSLSLYNHNNRLDTYQNNRNWCERAYTRVSARAPVHTLLGVICWHRLRQCSSSIPHYYCYCLSSMCKYRTDDCVNNKYMSMCGLVLHWYWDYNQFITKFSSSPLPSLFLIFTCMIWSQQLLQYSIDCPLLFSFILIPFLFGVCACGCTSFSVVYVICIAAYVVFLGLHVNVSCLELLSLFRFIALPKQLNLVARIGTAHHNISRLINKTVPNTLK